jgi:hypothetical protein
MSTIKDMLTSKKGIVGVVKDAKESIKKNRALQSRVSQQYPSDTLGQHFKRVGNIKRIQEWVDFENSTSNRPVEPSPKKPSPKKPQVKKIPVNRERLLPR